MIRKFVTTKCGGDNRLRREHCGRLSGVVGVVLNLLLGLVKLFVGMAAGSMAVMADAVNNLTDAASSVITIVGFELASRKSDDEHPFGHARIEYMTGAIVSGIIIAVGVKLITTSYDKVMHPTPVTSSMTAIVLLVILALVKLWLYRFNMKLSVLIGSPSLKATGIDSRNDAVSTAIVLISLLLDKLLGVHIDGYVGLAVGVFIIYSGLTMIRETAAPLLGQSADPRLIREIEEVILEHAGALGLHDLIVHDYGPGHVFASVHIEVDSRVDIFVSHSMVDRIEMEAKEKLGVLLVGHMDPIDTQNPKVAELRKLITGVLAEIDGARGMHDLRLVPGPDHINVIFDAVVAHENSAQTFDVIKEQVQAALTEKDPAYIAVVNSDLDYAAGR
ncbi:MAG: cation diffusion facilitator family transporter [Clostridiales Family XIII bacterium]|nr:cation diffusion facilitator family transporter [Clostridiales Family XIII bacterium]